MKRLVVIYWLFAAIFARANCEEAFREILTSFLATEPGHEAKLAVLAAPDPLRVPDGVYLHSETFGRQLTLLRELAARSGHDGEALRERLREIRRELDGRAASEEKRQTTRPPLVVSLFVTSLLRLIETAQRHYWVSSWGVQVLLPSYEGATVGDNVVGGIRGVTFAASDGTALYAHLDGKVLIWNRMPHARGDVPTAEWPIPFGVNVTDLAARAGRLYVADPERRRILVRTEQAVYEIPIDCGPHVRLAVDDGHFLLADRDGGRVLAWRGEPTGPPFAVLTHPGMRPSGISIIDGKIYVSDGDGNRVLVWNEPANGAAPSAVIGQPDFSTTEPHDLEGPHGVFKVLDELWITTKRGILRIRDRERKP